LPAGDSGGQYADDRQDKYTNLYGGNTIMTSTTYMIKTHPLPITMMAKYPPIHRPRWPELQEQGGNGGTLTKYLGKSRKPKTD